MNELLARWWSLPRAVRWLAMLVVGVGGYFLAVEPVLDWRAERAADAEALSEALARGADRSGADARAGAALKSVRFGSPLAPGGEERIRELNARVEAIFSAHRVTNLTIRARAPVSLGRDAFAPALPAGTVAQRAGLDIEFEAPPETATAVLAALESAPEVASVARLVIRRLDREGQRRLSVSVAPEAWIFAPARGGGGGRS